MTIRKGLFLTLAVFLLTGVRLSPQKLPSSDSYDAIYFRNDREGYLRVFREFGQDVLRTLDGGKSWNVLVGEPTAVGIPFRRGRIMVDDLLGWSIEDAWPHKNIYKTTDGGVVWKKCKVAGGTSNSSLTAIQVLSVTEVWVVGTESYRTTDGGETWERLTLSGDAIAVIPPKSVWVADNVLWKSSDGGVSWREIRFPREIVRGMGSGDIFFVNERLGWMVGGRHEEDRPDGAATSVVLFTENGGETWARISKVDGHLLSAVFFLNEKVGWVAGNKGAFLKTEDGGRTWSRP